MQHTSYPPQAGYRAGGAAPGALPLPRTGLAAVTVALILFALLTLIAPLMTILVVGHGAHRAFEFLKEGGIWNYAILFFDPICTIAIAALGMFVARGKKIPVALLMGIALFPLVLGVLGAMAGQRMTFSAISGESVALGQKLRILAEGFSESNTPAVLGSVSSAFLCALAAIAVVGSVLDVDTRRMAPKRDAWVLGTGLGVGLAVIAIVVRVLSPSWAGGLGAKLGLLAVLAAAAVAGPTLARVKAIDDAQDPSEVGRLGAAVLTGAILLGLSAFLFDHAAFVVVERLVLGAVSGESVDPSQRVPILYEVAPGVAATRVSMIVDTGATVLAFAPAIAASLRRPSWGHMGAAIALAMLFAIIVGGANRYRQSKFDLMMAEVQRRQGEVPADLPFMPAAELGNKSDAADEVNAIVLASGATKEIAPSYGYSMPYVIAPDRNAPFAAIFEISRAGPRVHLPPPVSPYGNEQAPEQPKQRTLLAGRSLIPSELTQSLGDYAGFLGPSRLGYQVELAKTMGAPFDRVGLYVLATSPTDARVAVVEARLKPVERVVSFRDVAAARTEIEKLASSIGAVSAVLCPMTDARVGDVYNMIHVLHSAGVRGSVHTSTSGYFSARAAAPVYIVADRDAVTRAMHALPPSNQPGADTR